MKKYVYLILAAIAMFVMIAGVAVSQWDKFAIEFANSSKKEIIGTIMSIIGMIALAVFFGIAIFKDD